MKAAWATTTMKIYLFLDSNNVFENKVSAALMCSNYSKSKASFMPFISVFRVAVALFNRAYHNNLHLLPLPRRRVWSLYRGLLLLCKVATR